MEKDILVSELISIISKNAIGRSTSYPDGWINVDTIQKIAILIENGNIDRFGKIKELDGLKV